MLTSHSLTLSIFAVIGILFIFYLLRSSLLHPSYARWWSFAGVSLFVMGLFPNAFNKIAYFLGVSYLPIFFVILLFLIILIRLLLADMERTQLKIQIKKLTQQQAHLLYRVKNIEDIIKQEEK